MNDALATLMVFLQRLGTPFMVVGFFGLAFCCLIVGMAADKREKNDIETDEWRLGRDQQKAALPWAAFFVTLFVVGWAIPAVNYNVKVVEKPTYQPIPYESLFNDCMGSEGNTNEMPVDKLIAYQGERAKRAQVCAVTARDEATREIVQAKAANQNP